MHATGWLLEGDPAIRWQTLRDLAETAQNIVERERSRVSKEGWGARLLAEQNGEGRWARGKSSDGGLYVPKWTSTTYTMMMLRDFGLPPTNPKVQRACKLLLDGGFQPGGGIGYGPGAMAGAAMACRDSGKFCVGLMGDGDFVMSAGAIWSAVHQRAPMLLVINNNTTWGNDEKHQMHVAEDRHRPLENAWIGQRMVDPDIDHATVARGYGAWAKGPIFDPAELAGVFKEAVAEVERGRVAVVEVRTQLV